MKPQLTLALLALPLCSLGQGTLSGITDTRTSLYWLPLTSTVGIPENVVLDQFPAYHIASRADVLTLWADAGINTTPGFFGGTTNNWPSLFKFMDAMGSTYNQDGHPETFGMYEHGHVATIDFFWFNSVPVYGIGTDSLSYNSSLSWESCGTYIYTTVPEPCLAGLFLMCLLTIKRKVNQ